MANIYGIDLGTCNIKIFSKHSNKIIKEKNTIAVINKNQLYAYGDEAYAMYEKAPENINVSFPVTGGVIADYNNMQTMVQELLEKNVKGRKHAVIGMAAGTVLTTAAACLMNAFVLLPAYGKAFGMPIEAFIEMGAAVNSSVHSLLGFVALIIVPFNLFKYTLTSVIVFFIYKRIRVILKGD